MSQFKVGDKIEYRMSFKHVSTYRGTVIALSPVYVDFPVIGLLDGPSYPFLAFFNQQGDGACKGKVIKLTAFDDLKTGDKVTLVVASTGAELEARVMAIYDVDKSVEVSVILDINGKCYQDSLIFYKGELVTECMFLGTVNLKLES